MKCNIIHTITPIIANTPHNITQLITGDNLNLRIVYVVVVGVGIRIQSKLHRGHVPLCRFHVVIHTL